MALYDLAHAYATTYPVPATGEGTWSQMCGNLMYRFGAYTTPGWNPSAPLYPAAAVGNNSGPLNPDSSTAPIGAFHFWYQGGVWSAGDGHVACDLLGGGNTCFMASLTLAESWGTAIGVNSVAGYSSIHTGLTYAGWSMNYGGATLAVPASTASTTVTPFDNTKEEDDMPNIGIYWNRTPDNAQVNAIVNTTSGFFSSFVSADGAYNNAIAASFGTTAWAHVSESHATKLQADCAATRARA